jgi:hypothetical protein
MLLDMPFADKVNLSHDPPSERDGPIDGAALSAIARAEVEAMARAFAEPPEREVLHTSVEGRFVTTRTATRGMLVDGTPIDYETEVVLEVDDGVIVGMRARLDEANATQHRMVLTAGQFQRPTGNSEA